MPLAVGIIGAGIGGLSAAIGLRRAGAEVEIFERSMFKNEIGAAITITPNGSRVLDLWGFDDVKAGVVEAQNLRMVHAHTLDAAFVEELADVPRRFGGKMGFYHRVDLHSTLKDMALSKDPEQPGTPAVIRLGAAVADVDCEAGVIILGDGSRVTKNLLVIADGIKSHFVSKITGEPDEVEEHGWSAYRCLIPMKAILSDPRTAPIWAGHRPGYWTPFYLPEAFYMVAYTCRNNTMLNIALRHTTQPKDRDKEDWNSAATHDDVLAVLAPYHPIMGDIIRKAPDVKIYRLVRREPLARYHRGRAVIIGDAAHTILPTHAQGAVLAIEEAAALEVLFDGVGSDAQPTTSRDDVKWRLELYSKLMLKHIHAVQHLSDSIPGTRDEYRRKAEDVCGEDIFGYDAMNFTAPVREFFYGYDVRKEVLAGMQRAGL